MKDTFYILDIKVKGELKLVAGANEKAAMARARLKFREFEVVRRQSQSEFKQEMGI